MQSSSRNPEHRSLILFLIISLALTIVVQSFGPNHCLASMDESGNLIFILDASGSMGAQIQGRAKMDIAKEVLSGLIKDLPAGVNVGLVAYGHRQKSDCNDVEELAPLGPLDKQALTKKIHGLSHKGKTPITISVRKVAENLKTSEDEATIILVSDGAETCEGDPCSLVKELKESGIKFVMHVIGFDVTDKEKTQLACIAESGGGSYFSAKNAGEFSLAAKKVVEKTEQSAGKLKLKALRNGKPFRVYCEIHKPVENEEKGEREKVTEGWVDVQGETFKLTPGIYDIIVTNQDDSNSPAVNFKAIAIEAGKMVEKTADFSGGTLKLKAQRNGKPFRAYSEIYKRGEDEEKGKEKVAEGWVDVEGESFKLTPGVYDVKIINEEDNSRPSVDFAAVTVEAGKNTEKVADFSGGTLRVRALRNGKPFRAYCSVYKPSEDEEKDEQEKVTEGWVDVDGQAFKLTPGIYDVKVTNEEDANSPEVIFQAVTIEAGGKMEKVAEFSGGSLKVKASKNGKALRAYCEVIKGGEGEEEDAEQKVTEGWLEPNGTSFKLSPGVYVVIVTNNDTDEKKELEGVNVEAGKLQNVDVQF